MNDAEQYALNLTEPQARDIRMMVRHDAHAVTSFGFRPRVGTISAVNAGRLRSLGIAHKVGATWRLTEFGRKVAAKMSALQ